MWNMENKSLVNISQMALDGLNAVKTDGANSCVMAVVYCNVFSLTPVYIL